MERNPREIIIEGQARLAELDLQLNHLNKRRETLRRYLDKVKRQAKQLNIPLAPEEVKAEPYSQIFEEVWSIFTHATKRNAEKRAAFKAFKKIEPSDYDTLRRAIRNYTESREVVEGFGVYMKRFLKEDFWVSWINKQDPPTAANSKQDARSIARGVLK